MSLINDALKKAQKLRSGDPGTVAPMPGGNARVTKRGEPRSPQQLVLIASGGVALVVLSVVATFWFVNRTPASAPAPAPKSIAVKTPDVSAPSPAIVAPIITPPTVAETPPEKTAAQPEAVEKPALTPASPPAATTAKAATVASVTTPAAEKPVAEPAPAATPSATAPTDPRVHAFVDAIKVMGIRSSGGDSRVLMNDRVFRVNDIVDRGLGVRLTNVASDALTFTDSNGAIYVKNF